MKSKKVSDEREVAKREKLYSTLAKEEAGNTLKRLDKDKMRRHPASVRDDRWELKVDEAFAKTRLKKAQAAKRKA